jgi:hypothetical protein
MMWFVAAAVGIAIAIPVGAMLAGYIVGLAIEGLGALLYRP